LKTEKQEKQQRIGGGKTEIVMQACGDDARGYFPKIDEEMMLNDIVEGLKLGVSMADRVIIIYQWVQSLVLWVP